MLPTDWEGGDDPGEAQAYLAELQQWTDDNDALVRAQAKARNALDAAEARVGVLRDWVDRLNGRLGPLSQRRGTYDAVQADLTSTSTQITADDAAINDLREAYAVGTARLLGDVPATTPLVLLPLRLETHWTTDALLVRIFPDEIGVDSHDQRLTVAEQQAGQRYWAGVGDEAQTLQGWEELVRQSGAPRAGWVARSTQPGHPAQGTRTSGWDTVVSAGLLPDRFAVIPVADGTVRAARSGQGPHVVWGGPVPAELGINILAPVDAGSWLTSFDQAEAVGMAVRVPIDNTTAPIEALLVVGVRTSDADLAGVISGHSFTGGLQVMPDAAPTNNSDDRRAALDRVSQSAAARAQLDDPPAPGVGTAGADLAKLLGVPAETFGGVRGADRARSAQNDAMRQLIGAGTTGALRDALDGGDAIWQLVSGAGPAATLRVGRQPYGVLPTSAPRRWIAQTGEVTEPLADALQRWGHSTGPQRDLDPLDPPAPVVGGLPRIDADALVESPGSIAWQQPNQTYAGLDDLVGPATGPTAPAAYLAQIAATDPGGLPVLSAALPSLLAQIAIAAKLVSDQASQPAANTALLTLAAGLDPGSAEDSRAALGQLLASTLDAASHRLDAWVTAAVTERLLHLRTVAPTTTVVGSYGWLTDLQPGPATRSNGHILAPSLAHAATAAVLRAGYLSEVATNGRAVASRQPMAVDLSSARVRAATTTLTAVRAGQPLAAVLGRQFEDDLVAMGLQRYLATFRKLTRFRTGTQLEALEQARHQAQRTVANDQQQLVGLQQTADTSQQLAAQAAAGLVAAEKAQAAAALTAAPYVAQQARQAFLRDSEIARLTAALAVVDGQRQTPGLHTHTIKVPVP